MNKQAIGPTRVGAPDLLAESFAGPKTEKPDAKEFEAQIAAAATMVQPLVPQATPNAPAPTSVPGEGIAQAKPEQAKLISKDAAQNAVALAGQMALAPNLSAKGTIPTQALNTLTPAQQTGPNTGSALAGLKQPQLAGIASQGAAPVVAGQAQLSPNAKATRGDVDMSLASQIELLSVGSPLAAKAGGAQGAMGAAGSGAQDPAIAAALQAMLQQSKLQHAGQTDAVALNAQSSNSNAMLEAQLAALGGAMEGGTELGQDSTTTEANPGAKGRLGGGKGAVKGQRLPGGAAQAALSGDEFLTTLGAAKGGLGAKSDLTQGEGKGGQLGAKPSLKVIPGAKGLNGKVGFETELTSQQSLGNLAGAKAHGAPLTAMAGGAGAMAEVTGHVVQGANAEQRLTNEALAGISTGVRNLSAQGTGGEMRIRLKPENLGELHVRVVTDGRNVGLQIQASDEKAKKILEESLSHLKDSLAAQSLTLGSVDLTVGRAQQGSDLSQNQSQQQSGQHAQNAFGDLLGGRQGQGQSQDGGSRAWANDGGNAGFAQRSGRAPAMSAAQFGGSARSAQAASGRLDVTA